MVNKVQLAPDGIIEIWVIGDQTADSVREMGEKVGFYIGQQRQIGQPALVLDNLLRLGATDSAARREVARLGRTLSFDRLAMLGGSSPVMRYGTNLMLHAIGRPNIHYFDNAVAARQWLLASATIKP